MTAKLMRDFANRIASASPQDEKNLFNDAQELFADAITAVEATRWHELICFGAFNEAAIAIYQKVLAERGFQFGPLAYDARAAVRSRGLASSWRIGDDHAAVHSAATPALALLHAAMADSAKSMEECETANCSLCGGLGWFLTATNDKELCRHARQVA